MRSFRPVSAARRLAGSPARLLAALFVPLAALPLLLVPVGRADDREERPIGPGVRLLRWTREAGPHALYAVEIDSANPFTRLGVTLGGAGSLALEPLSRQAERLTRPERYPIAGVNGDFFLSPGAQCPGIPTNVADQDGELIRKPLDRPVFIIDGRGRPAIRTVRANGRIRLPDGAELPLADVNEPRGSNRLVLFTPRYGPATLTPKGTTEVYLEPESFPLRHGVAHAARVLAAQAQGGSAPIAPGRWVLAAAGPAAEPLKRLKPGDALEVRVDLDPALGAEDQVIGGSHRLLRDGKLALEEAGGSLDGAFITARHPRTAVGYNGSRIYLLAADGRQPGYSAGMSLPELAQAMLELGCTDALNLDGGGSTTLWARGALVNRPSDGRERPVANALMVFSTAPQGDPVRLLPLASAADALAGAALTVSASGEDQHYNPRPVSTAEAAWTFPEALGEVRDGRLYLRPDVTAPAGQDFVSGDLVMEWKGIRGSTPVRVYPRPARVEVQPAAPRVPAGKQVRFRVRAYSVTGRPLELPAQVEWAVTPEAGAIDASGLLTAGAVGKGTAAVSINGVTASVPVEISDGTPRTVDDFENAADWKLSTAAGAAGEVSASDTARTGRRALRLAYDFSEGTGTRAVYALAGRPLGSPFALRAWVYGDGQSAWLRARLRDAKGTAHVLDLARRVDWKDTWKELRVPISDTLPGPLTLEALYIVEADAARKPRGALLIDDLAVE
jgi:hypothetical protein